MMKNLRQHKVAMQANCIFAIIIAVVLGFAFPKTANAYAEASGESYKSAADYGWGISVNGVEVTSENCNDLSVIKGVSGTVKYDPDANTLYLEDATIVARLDGINSRTAGLIINVSGENNIKNDIVSIYSAINLKFIQATIKGGGTLNLESTCGCGIYFEKALVIDGCTVNAKGVWGIYGDDGTTSLTIRNATVTAEGESGSVCNIASLTLDGCEISTPVGAAFDESLHAVALDGQTVTDKVVVAPNQPVNYRLAIADINVTSENCNDLSVIDGVSGTVKYVPYTKTLYLENATIAANFNGIANLEIDGLTIDVTGENNITATYAALDSRFMATTITGNGILNFESDSDGGIYFQKSLEIEGCTVNAKGKWGIAGANGKSENLTIRNAVVTAEGRSGSVCDIASLTLDGCDISKPVGAAFDESLHAVALDGQTVTDKVVVSPVNCGIWINGVEITNKNCNDLSVIDGVNGTVKYAPETKTLYMENATIATDVYGIVNYEVDGFTINVIGENNLTTINNATLDVDINSTTIKGGGTLNIETNSFCGIYFAKSLEIDNCTVNVKGKWGIAGANGASEELTIRNATVSAEGISGSICDILSLTLDGATITQPIGAEFDEALHAVALDGQTVTDKVVIKADHAVGINDVKAEKSERKQGTYSLDGVYFGHDFEALPKGIYIKDGKKVIK